MIIIKPLTLTDGMLVSNIAENDYAAYNGATSYSLGDRVISTVTHRIYRSLVAGNVGNALTDTASWLNERATNRWRMFDQRIADKATNPMTIDVTITPGEIVNSITLMGLDANELIVTVTDPIEGVVYSQTYSLIDNDAVTDWYSYFFEPVIRKSEFILLDIPNYLDASIRIQLNVDSGDAGVGEIILGAQRSVGETLLGVSLGIQSFSTKTRDAYGNWEVVPRDYSDAPEFPLLLPNGHIPWVKKFIAELLDTPVVVAGKDDGGWGTLAYGFIQDFRVVIAYNVESDCIVTFEGLT